MFLQSILLFFSFPLLAETCFPTIPPDEYYPTSTLPDSATQKALMPSTENSEATTSGGEEGSTTAGGGGGAGSSTATEEENKCNECEISAIEPVLADPATLFYSEPRDPVDGCMTTYAICRRDDDKLCDNVEMFATNADGAFPITGNVALGSIDTIFTCGADGKYKWETITGIESLSCNFINCD
ncbi:unnamed protein product [Caenorhabditis brenneri]